MRLSKIKFIFCVSLVSLALSTATALAEKGRINPFSLPQGVEFKGDELPKVTDLALQAVVEGTSRRVATINNRNYLVGDVVRGREIVEISPNHVILADGTRHVELGLNREPFSIRVTPAKPE